MGSRSERVKSQIGRAIEILKAGGIVAYPTDTVYGLGCDVFNSEAIDRIYKVKQRPRNQPFSVLLADTAQVTAVVDSVSGVAQYLMRRFWRRADPGLA